MTSIQSSAIDKQSTLTGVSNLPIMAVQQRQILALMGVDVWVSQNRQTQQVDYANYAAYVAQDSELLHIDKGQQQAQINKQAQQQAKTGSNTTAQQALPTETNNTANKELTAKTPAVNTPAEAIKSLVAKTKPHDANKQKQSAVTKPVLPAVQVAPFEVVAAHYHGWVLLADTADFAEEQVYQLWQNILHGLSLTADLQKFPICTGISDQESANACLAGFVFRVAQSVDVNVAALTPMPEGVAHDKVVRVPYLAEMLADSQSKRQLWQMIAPHLD